MLAPRFFRSQTAGPVSGPAKGGALQRRHEAQATTAALPALVVSAGRLADSVVHGLHGRRRAGPGDGFWQYRPYEAGEPAHRIDWRRSARSQGLYVRQRENEIAQGVWLWRNADAGMDWHSRTSLPAKRAVADLLLLALASLLVRGGERVALAGNGERPGIGRPALDRLALGLEHGVTALAPRALAQLPRGADLVLISDFLAPWEETLSLLEALRAAGVRAHLLQVLDPAEETLPYEGRVEFLSAGGADDHLTVPRVEAVREGYLQRLEALRGGLADFSARCGWSFLQHRTDRPATIALMALWASLSGRGLEEAV
jgi:uncharacterized protein (DUF58 family)